MRLFMYLLVGHLIGDFLLQSPELVRLKRVKQYGVYPHVALVALATTAASLGSTPLIWLVIAFVTVTHLLLDRISILAFSHTGARQVFLFLADQLAHVGVLSLIAWTFVGPGGQPIGRAWLLPVDDWGLALICGVLAVAFAGSIFAFETTEAVEPSDPKTDEGALLGYSPRRLAGMAERAVLYLVAVLGFYPWVGLWALARSVWAATRPAADRRRALASAGATIATVVLVAAVTVALRPLLETIG